MLVFRRWTCNCLISSLDVPACACVRVSCVRAYATQCVAIAQYIEKWRLAAHLSSTMKTPAVRPACFLILALALCPFRAVAYRKGVRGREFTPSPDGFLLIFLIFVFFYHVFFYKEKCLFFVGFLLVLFFFYLCRVVL